MTYRKRLPSADRGSFVYVGVQTHSRAALLIPAGYLERFVMLERNEDREETRFPGSLQVRQSDENYTAKAGKLPQEDWNQQNQEKETDRRVGDIILVLKMLVFALVLLILIESGIKE